MTCVLCLISGGSCCAPWSDYKAADRIEGVVGAIREGPGVADEDDRRVVVFVIYRLNIAGFEIYTTTFEKAVYVLNKCKLRKF